MNLFPTFRPALAAAVAVAATAGPVSAQIQVEVNSRPVQFGAVQPARIQGRVFIPLRAVVEALGAEIKWEPATQTVYGQKGEREFRLPIGARTALVNGQPVTLDVPAQLISGTTMVPLRFVAEALGAEVEWNAGLQRVGVSLPEEAVAGGDRISGEVVSVQPDRNPATITVRANGVRSTYRVGRDTVILRGEEGKRAAAAGVEELQPGDRVRLRVDENTGVAEVVEATYARAAAPPPPTAPAAPAGRVSGQIVAIQRGIDSRKVSVKTGTGTFTYDLHEDTVITRAEPGKPGVRADLRDLRVGDEVVLRTDRPGKAVEVLEAVAAAGEPIPVVNGRVTGEVVSVQPDSRPATITVRRDGAQSTFRVPSDALVFRAEDGGQSRRVDLDEVRPGDRVRVRLDPSAAQAEVVEATGPAVVAERRLTGEVVALQPKAKPPTITLQVGNRRVTVPLNDETILLRGEPGKRPGPVDPDELQVGDQVKIRLDERGGAAELVEATGPAVALPEPSRNLRITSLAHDADSVLRAGATVRVTLVGTPGGTASFDVGSLAKDVPMREDPQQRGRYVGSFTVPRGTTAKNVPVIAQLRSGAAVAPLVQAGTLLNIDSEPPVISEVAPKDRLSVTAQQPDIYAEISDGTGTGLDLDTLQLFVRGQEVTNQAKVTPRFLIYTPKTPLPAGPVPVVLTVKDQAGNRTEKEWSFTVEKGVQPIQAVTHNADKPLGAGDVLTVTVKAQPRGRASFSIGDEIRDIPLREEAPGTYTGRYTVRRGDQLLKAPLTVDFTSASGANSRLEATAPVNFVTRDPDPPKITYPVERFRLDERLVVEGTAAPKSRVLVEVTWTGKAFGALPVQGTLGSQEIGVDEKGRWITEPFQVRLPLGVRRPELTIRAVAQDPAGTESEPATVTVQTR